MKKEKKKMIYHVFYCDTCNKKIKLKLSEISYYSGLCKNCENKR